MLNKKIKGCTSLVLSTLCVGASVASQQTANAAWYDFLWYLMPTSWWNNLFEEDTCEEKIIKVLDNNLKHSDKGLSGEEKTVERKKEVISILKAMDKDLHKNDIDEIHRASFNNINPISAWESYTFCVPYFKSDKNIGTKGFAHIEVKNNKVLFYRFVDEKLEKYREEKGMEVRHEGDIFEKISLEEENAVGKVKKLASKVLNINKLFCNLFDICKQLSADISEKSYSGDIEFFFSKDNESKYLRYFSKKMQSVAKNKYICKVVVGAETEKITIFYRVLGEHGRVHKKTYDLLNDDNRVSLLQIFSEENIVENNSSNRVNNLEFTTSSSGDFKIVDCFQNNSKIA